MRVITALDKSGVGVGLIVAVGLIVGVGVGVEVSVRVAVGASAVCVPKILAAISVACASISAWEDPHAVNISAVNINPHIK